MYVKLFLGTAALLSVAALAAPAAGAQQDGPFQCLATSTDGGHITMYLSQMIPSGGAAPSAAINTAWGDFVKAAYKVQNLSTAICRQLPADPDAQQRVQDAYQKAASRGSMQLVNVNGAPGQNKKPDQNPNTNPYAAAAPPADAKSKDAPAVDPQAAPPADAGPQPRSSYCYSDDKKPTIYFSDAFDTVDLPSPKAWANAYLKFLVQKFSYKGTVTCKDSDTIFNAQSAIRDQKDALTGKETIDTDWTYTPPAPGDPAAAAADAPADTPAPTPPKKKSAAKPSPQN
jgi:hypothetical protein